MQTLKNEKPPDFSGGSQTRFAQPCQAASLNRRFNHTLPARPCSVNTAGLKRALPLPQLMARLGYEQFAKPSCKSPFREDKNASFGIFERHGSHGWKDHGNGDGGDEITFLARHLKMDPKRDFKPIANEYQRLAGLTPVRAIPQANAVTLTADKPKPDKSVFSKGTPEQCKAIVESRGIGLPGIHLAMARGFLLFGKTEGHEVWAITDCTGRVLEARRMDRGLFANGQKCKALPGSEKRPVGLVESKPYPTICLTEGAPDFLECWHLVILEEKQNTVAVVTMLGGGNNFNADDLHYFKGKTVRIFAHADEAGILSAERWQHQLLNGGANTVDLFDFAPHGCKDLLESSSVIPAIERMLP